MSASNVLMPRMCYHRLTARLLFRSDSSEEHEIDAVDEEAMDVDDDGVPIPAPPRPKKTLSRRHLAFLSPRLGVLNNIPQTVSHPPSSELSPRPLTRFAPPRSPSSFESRSSERSLCKHHISERV